MSMLDELNNMEPTDLGVIEVVGQRRKPTTGSVAGFNLDEFSAEIHHKSILENCRYLMQFSLPRGLLQQYDPSDVRKVMLRGDASALPGVGFAESEEIRRYGVGPSSKQPYMPIFGPVPASYIVDGSGVIHSFFYDWLSLIIGFDSSQGMSAINAFGVNPYEVAYKEDYVSEVSIFVYNPQNQKIMEVILHNAYPVSMEQVPLSWATTNDFMKLNVTWDYTDWSAKYYDAISGSQIPGINTLRTITDAAGRLAGLSQQLGLSSNVTGMITNFASKSQKLADIASVVSGGSRTIVDSVKRRFGF